MNKGFGFSAVALAFSLGALPFGSIAEEVPPPPPQEQPQPPRPLPPPQRKMMHRGPHRGPAAEVRDGAGKRAPREAGMRQGRPERKGVRRMMERCFTEPERNELREARRKLMTAEAGSAEAKTAITEMNGVFERALERVDNDLAKAKENKQEKETAELEQAKKMLSRMAERTADPEKYLEAMKNRPAPRKRAEKK